MPKILQYFTYLGSIFSQNGLRAYFTPWPLYFEVYTSLGSIQVPKTLLVSEDTSILKDSKYPWLFQEFKAHLKGNFGT